MTRVAGNAYTSSPEDEEPRYLSDFMKAELEEQRLLPAAHTAPWKHGMGWYAWLSPLVYAALGGLLMLGVLHATSSPAANWQCTQCTGPPAAQPPQNMPGGVKTDASELRHNMTATAAPAPAAVPAAPAAVLAAPAAVPEAPAGGGRLPGAAGCPNSTASPAGATVQRCQYGWQPGLWHKSPGDPISLLIQADEDRSLVFEAANPRCALKPLAQHYIALSRVQHNSSEESRRALEWTTQQVGERLAKRIASGPPLTMLFFGDSVDAKLLSFFCYIGGGAAKGDGKRHRGSHCATDRIVVTKFHFFGVHLDGPWFEGEGAPPLGLVDEAMAYFKNITGLDSPDIYNIQSCFWDAGRLWEQDQAWVRAHEVLPAPLLHGFTRNLTAVATKLKGLMGPKSMGFYHTPARVAFRKKAEWWSNSPHLDQHISQLAAAGRAMAADVGLTTVDFELMALPLQKETYLKDRMHPFGAFLTQMLNLYLNAYFQEEQLRGGGAA